MDTKRKNELTEEELVQVRRAMDAFGNAPLTPVVKAEAEEKQEVPVKTEEKPVKKRKIWKKIVAVIAAVALIAGLSYGVVYLVRVNKIVHHPSSMANRNDTIAVTRWGKRVVVICNDGSVHERVDNSSNEYRWVERKFEGEALSLAWRRPWKSEQFALLRTDGTVHFSGEIGSDWKEWSDIKMLAMGNKCLIGLHENGTVSADGENRYGACAVNRWRNIIGIDVDLCYTAGLRADGTVVVTTISCPISDINIPSSVEFYENKNAWLQEATKWHDIVAISAAGDILLGLKADGTVTAVYDTGIYQYSNYNFDDWFDIVAIDAVDNRCIGVRSDGTVMLEGFVSGLKEERLQELTAGLHIVDAQFAGTALYLLTDEGVLYEVSDDMLLESEETDQWCIIKVFENVKLP